MNNPLHDLAISLKTLNKLIYDDKYGITLNSYGDNLCYLVVRKHKLSVNLLAQFRNQYSVSSKFNSYKESFIRIEYYKEEDAFIVSSCWSPKELDIFELFNSIVKISFMYKKCNVNKNYGKISSFHFTHTVKNSKANRKKIVELVDLFLNMVGD